MSLIRIAVLVLTLTLSALFALEVVAQPVHKINGDNYAAIAFSKSTGHYGYGYDCGTLGHARRVALSHCNEADVEIVAWVQFGWAVLVVAEDGAYATGIVHGKGASSGEAVEKAKRNLLKHSNRPIKKMLILCSGDVDPVSVKYEK